MAAMVCRNVLMFDPSDTMPPSTAAIEAMAATSTRPEDAEYHDEQQCDADGDRRL